MKIPMIINLEGNDGTGKRSVALALQHELQQYDIGSKIIDFPQYDTTTGKVVTAFLNGDICGDPVDADPYLGSMAYTLDRVAYLYQNPNLLSEAPILIFNRSYMSNYFYQFSKFIQPGKWKTTFVANVANWLAIQYSVEIQQTILNRIENPSRQVFNIYIKADSIEDNHKKLLQRYENDPSKLDYHERNFAYLKSVEDTAVQLCGIPFTADTRLNAFYDYKIVGLKTGTDKESIDKCIADTVNSIFAIIGLAGYTQSTSETKKENVYNGSGD